MAKLGDPQLIKRLMPYASVVRRWVKFGIFQFLLACVIVMIARPQMGSKVSNEKRNGIEAIICLDISNSMLAGDVVPSRLEKSKMLIEGMVDKFSNDKIGLIVFAGDAFVQLPITSDYVSAKMFLQNIDPSLIQTQGTDIAHAINLAMNSFTQQEKIGKAIIVITDGEDHEGGAEEAASAAKAKGMNVFILGVGDTAGAPIPTGDGDYMTDNTGQTVMTALNEQMCRDIASAGKGTYIHVDNTSAAQEKLNNELTKLQQGEMKSVIYSEYNEQFQVFGIIAIILIIIEICVFEAVNPYFRRITIFKKRQIATVALMLLLPLVSMAQTDRQHIRSGNKVFRSGDAAKSEVEYRKAIAKNAANSQAVYNLACALMQQQKDSDAIATFQKAAQMEKSKQRRFLSYHNMGCILQRHQLYKDAIEAYKQALRLNPSDDETRYNYVLCKRLLKNQPQDNKNDQQDKKEKKEQQDKQQDQNKDKDKDKDKEKQQNPQNQMSKDNAEQLLNAAMQNEKATQQRMNQAKQQPQRRNLQKNW